MSVVFTVRLTGYILIINSSSKISLNIIVIPYIFQRVTSQSQCPPSNGVWTAALLQL